MSIMPGSRIKTPLRDRAAQRVAADFQLQIRYPLLADYALSQRMLKPEPCALFTFGAVLRDKAERS